MYHTCIWCILVFYISLHMSYKYIYIYICFQPASHGDMTSSMVLKSPARPVLDGPVPPWRLGSNSGYVTDRWMWKKWWEKMMGFLHRTVKWNQMGYRTTSSLCRPWNCFFFCWCFFCFLSTFLLAGYGPGDRRLCSWKEETTGIKQLGMVEIRVLEWMIFAFTYEVVRLDLHQQYERRANFRFGEGRVGAASMLEFFKLGNVPPTIQPILHHWVQPITNSRNLFSRQSQVSTYTTSFSPPKGDVVRCDKQGWRSSPESLRLKSQDLSPTFFRKKVAQPPQKLQLCFFLWGLGG